MVYRAVFYGSASVVNGIETNLILYDFSQL
jgi:hypothetical protein